MRFSALAVACAACLAWSGCSGRWVAPPPASAVAPADGTTVQLKVGESARSADGRLRFGVEQVTADSRCPRGAQCVWAGDAVVRVWLQHGAGPRESRDLHTSPAVLGEPGGPGGRRGEIELLRLEPWPVAGRITNAAEYVATLDVAASSAGAQAER